MSEQSVEPVLSVTRDDSTGRYLLFLDGREVGQVEFQLDDGAVVFMHTEIAKDAGRGGLGTFLVREALADVRERELTVVPLCQFVGRYLDRHPDEAVLARP